MIDLKPDPRGPFTLPHFRAWAADLILDSGQSFHPEDWQEAFVADVFAGFPECWLVVPEGNGKTTLLAALALYHCEHRLLASIPVAASSREQAEIMYRQAEGFVLRSPRLYEPMHSAIQAAKGKHKTEMPRFLCLEGYRRINHFEGGRIQVFAADDRTGDGVIPTLGVLDELHRHRDLSLYRTWAGKLLKRSGQIVTISTAGEPGSDFEETRERIRQGSASREGAFVRAVSGRTVLHEWALPEDGDPEDIEQVKAANPFSGVTLDDLGAKFASPAMTLQYWRRFVCNLPTRSEYAAIQEAEWFAAETDDPIPPGEPIWLGADIAWKWDTTALVPLWMRDEHYRLFGPPRVLIPPRDGTSLDPAKVERALEDIHKRNPIHTVAMDTNRAEQLGAWIEKEIGAAVLDVSQGIPVQVEEYERFMEALRNGWLKHSGDRDLTRHALNAVAKIQRGGDAIFERPIQSRRDDQNNRVIDALKAAAMVHRLAAMRRTADKRPSKYNDPSNRLVVV
ncbi:MAG: phage terminase family protein [Chloroflexi bacterium]|nr:phage terminase family protein [Chloroflexota bacterium]